MKQIAILALAVGLAWQSRATIDLSFTGALYSGTGEITAATDDGGGLFTATAGFISLNGGPQFQLDPVPTGSSLVTIHGVANTGGGDLFGDNILGQNFISTTGLLFTLPQVNGNSSSFTGDVINIWGNGNGSYSLAAWGPDFPAGQAVENEVGSVNVVPVPEPATTGIFMALWALVPLAFALRRTNARAA